MNMHKFKLSRVAAAVMFAVATPAAIDLAHAGAGVASSTDWNGGPMTVPTYYANSPAGTWTDWTGAVHNSGTPLRKFVDTLPGLGAAGANTLTQAHGRGQYIPVAAADTTSYPGTEYYEIGIVEYTEKMHRDLPKATTLRGYVQLETAANAATSRHIPLTYPDGTPIRDANGAQILAVDNPHYLGPLISATRGTPVRIKYSNLLPKGRFDAATGQRNGDLFIPVDTTLMGAGLGPNGGTEMYTQNRAEIHLHGGDNAWISDGTPHQWTVPAGETTSYKKGVSFQNVPDMPDPGDGSGTLYWTNGDSGRLMFYHDHTSGITRLNVYAGEAAGYLLSDPVEQAMVTSGVLPAAQIPLVIQEKTFVPADIAQQDAKWDTTHWGQPGDLWFPHVYEPNQDPNSFDGTNPPGRWDWGPWFWPVFPSANPLPTGVYGDATTTPEAFMDTPIVNGAAYPTLTVDPQAYRLRILSAANDRSISLGLYVAEPLTIGVTGGGSGYTVAPAVTITPAAGDTSGTTATATATVAGGAITGITVTSVTGAGFTAPPTVTIAAPPVGGTRATAISSVNTEVKMVAATPPTQPLCSTTTAAVDPATGLPVGAGASCWPDLWPTDGRDGGVPDPLTAGPKLIQIGSEGGLLPAPVEIPSTPLNYEYNRRSATVLGVFTHGLYLAPAERADVIVDFSQFAGKTLVLYNDAPAPVPGFDPRVDYYTGNPDQTAVGGAPSTLPGYGPNTRTIMQIKVNAGTPVPYAPSTPLAAALPAAYAASQPKPIVPQAAYNTAFGTNWANTYATIYTGARYLGQYRALTFVTPENITYKPATPATTTAPTGTVTAPAGSTVSAYVENKAIQELFEPNYGRMNATLGVELPFTSAVIQTTIPLNYIDPITETVADGETQFWKITHNGVDTHPVHFHLVNVQVINRMGWDGTIKPPEENEVGWKETVKMNPLEDVVVAVRAKSPKVPFGMPNSSRLLDPTQPAGAMMGFTQVDPATGFPKTVTNVMADFGWEYVWHCHILGHEENDFMRPFVLNYTSLMPSAPILQGVSPSGVVTWADPTPAATSLGNQANEIGFRIERATIGSTGLPGAYSVIGTALANATTYTDSTASGATYSYRVAAYNAAGTSAVSNALTMMQPPAAPSGLAATPNVTAVALSWADNANNETGYQVLRNGTLIATLKANSTSYTNTSLSPNTTYSYTVRAVNTAGASSSAPVSVKTLAASTITAPSSLAATVASATQINLAWKDLSTNERLFNVWRSVNGGAAAKVGTVYRSITQSSSTGGTVSFANTGVSAGNTYTYYVTAASSSGQVSGSSNTVSVTTAAPAAPSGLTATAANNGVTDTVTLSWADNSNNEAGFSIQRATNSSFTSGLSTATAGANATTATQTGLPRGRTYYYRVRAANIIGNSGWSNVRSVTTP